MTSPTQPEDGKLVSRLFAVVLGAFLLLPACTETETVFVERAFFDDPPSGAGGYLGYVTSADIDQGRTVCGECHTGIQADWVTSNHAEAWEGLQASGAAQQFCESCHTVNARGNLSGVEGGWTATADVRYFDVQCESCHGPGTTHVSNPDASQPLASLAVAPGVGCGDCHEGSHHPFVDEWSESRHSQVIGFAAAREECAACHRGQATLTAWGVNDEYVERFSSEHLPVTCGVCHSPHGSPFEAQLRFPVQTTSFETHLCARCHDRRTAPDPNSSHGLAPHSPETALLEGTAGWFPPDAPIDEGQIRATHGSEVNDRLCATCHVDQFTVTDEVTGQFVFQATGHRFTAIPCVDAQGIPTAGPCELSTTARSFNGCTGAGCHGTEQAAFSALTAATTRLKGTAETLIDLLKQVDPGLDAAGGEIDASVPAFTVAEGAFFNYNLAIFPEEGDVPLELVTLAGSASHNPFLTEALLLGSIDAVEQEYGVQASVRLDWNAEIRALLDKLPAHSLR